jgi:uncharacterized alpha-E superfamily protein
MLSRVADALYWMGRYLERAENVTRLLLATEDLSTEIRGFSEKLALAEWSDLLAVFPGAEVTTGSRGAAAVALDHIAAFFVDGFNPSSVHFSLRKARENARAVREALSLEVFLTLNETYRELETLSPEQLHDMPACRGALSAIHKGLLSTAGAIEHTLSHDEGWTFVKLGESLERAYRTGHVLGAKLRSLAKPAPGLSLPLYYTQWRSLLRSLSSLENYRKVYGARMEPATVVHFLVFDPHAPRALRFGAETVKAHLARLAGADDRTPPARVVGRVAARLAYEDTGPAAPESYLPFIDEVVVEVGRTHDAIAQHYFGT